MQNDNTKRTGTAGMVFDFGIIDYALYITGGYMLIPNAKDLHDHVKGYLR